MFVTRYSRKSSVGVRFSTPSRTVQDCKTDVNSMVQRVLLGDSTALRRGVFADVSGAPESLQDMMLVRSRANTIWHDLPESLRMAVGSPDRLIEEYDKSLKPVENPVEKPVEKPVTPDGAKTL